MLRVSNEVKRRVAYLRKKVLRGMYRLSITNSDANSVITTGTSSSSSGNSTFTPPPRPIAQNMSLGGGQQGLDASEGAVAASKFRILAKNRQIHELDWGKEGQWNGAFCFVQAADTQFGMIDHYVRGHKDSPSWHDEINLTRKAIRAVNILEPKPRFFVVCGDLVDAMPGVSYKPDQVRDYKAVFSELDPAIHPICVCGNHDIGDTPTKSAIKQYEEDFGDDYFSFWVGGVKFLVMNSQFYHDDSLVKDLRVAHDRWMDAELSPDKPWKHLVGFQHIPPFVAEPDEGPVDVPGNPDLKFNFQDKAERRRYLHKLKTAGMKKLFCGHYHRNGGGWDEDLEVVVTSAIGCQLGNDTHGFRVIKVFEDRIEHQYYTLEDIPTSVSVA